MFKSDIINKANYLFGVFMSKVVVVGGGAAGMFAAYGAALNGKNVVLLEKNEKLGKKIYITGKGRCNLTANVLNNEFFQAVISNPKFVYSVINNFCPQDTINFFDNYGLKLKTERGNRVFPLSDKASDVTKTLEKVIVSLGVDVRLNTTVKGLKVQDNRVVGVITSDYDIDCDSAIICTGGISYPLTGSCGDGYSFAKSVGHNIVDLRSALVGIELCGHDFIEMQGLSLKNVSLSATINGKTVYSEFGEMLFTHYGISGPIVLSCSSIINRKNLSEVTISIDLKPALDFDTLTARLIREFKENNVKSISNAVRSLLPKTLINCVLLRAQINPNKKCCEISVTERNRLIETLKNLKFNVKKLRPIEEAIVTSGGVDVKEVNPKTMQSKLVNGLYFAGEVLDIDAFTGGYNLQLAFSTGYAAGVNC